MFDSSEFEQIISKLEMIEDEQLATKLLQQFSQQHSIVAKLLLNRDDKLAHDEWKAMCDLENQKLRKIIIQIDEVLSNGK